jgi:hypothetical protein
MIVGLLLWLVNNINRYARTPPAFLPDRIGFFNRTAAQAGLAIIRPGVFTNPVTSTGLIDLNRHATINLHGDFQSAETTIRISIAISFN